MAEHEMTKVTPLFTVGSIIVRERNDAGTDSSPEAVIAMVKRSHGFSKKTGDWEFLVLNESSLKLRSRETTGSCATCHIRAQKSDWTFLEHLK